MKRTIPEGSEPKQEEIVEVAEVNPAALFAAKIAKLIGAAKYVQKTGRNKFHGYNYATEADFLALVKPLLNTEKLAVMASTEQVSREEIEPTSKGRRQWLTTVKMSFKIIDGETGYSETLTAFGDGVDSEDKGLYKAITGCVKYFISKLFLIETGDDPEQDNENETSHHGAKNAAPKSNDHAAQSMESMAAEINKLMKLPCFTDEQRSNATQFNLEVHTHQEVAAKLSQIQAFIRKKTKEEAKNGHGHVESEQVEAYQ